MIPSAQLHRSPSPFPPPPLPIAQLVYAALPWLSVPGRAAISALDATRGRLESADRLAVWLGLGDRFRLARLLRREGLPAVGLLSDWICVLHLLVEWEATGQSLLRQSQRGGVQAATDYRRVRRTLGVTWREARRRGVAWALLRFRDACRRPAGVAGRENGGREAPGLVGGWTWSLSESRPPRSPRRR